MVELILLLLRISYNYVKLYVHVLSYLRHAQAMTKSSSLVESTMQPLKNNLAINSLFEVSSLLKLETMNQLQIRQIALQLIHCAYLIRWLVDQPLILFVVLYFYRAKQLLTVLNSLCAVMSIEA